MKTLALTFALAIASAGCLGNFVPNPEPAGGPPDMAHAPGTGGNGGTGGTGGGGGTAGSGGGGGGGGSSSTDMAITHVVSTDMAGVTPGAAAFGATCTANGDCQSLLCEPFVMGTVMRCTKPCTVATQTADCPAPPSAGTCTNNGYCKFNQ
jgi:hypothetical protein